jgi:cephalosporin hydroxylase
VLAELRAYAELVSPGSYIVVADAIMERLVGAPRSNSDWGSNNPAAAIDEFLAEDTRFVREEPEFAFNEGLVTERVTYWPGGYLRRAE